MNIPETSWLWTLVTIGGPVLLSVVLMYAMIRNKSQRRKDSRDRSRDELDKENEVPERAE